MALLFSRAIRYAARRVALNPTMREMAHGAAQAVAKEVKKVAGEEDKMRAAGRSLRRMTKRFRSNNGGS